MKKMMLALAMIVTIGTSAVFAKEENVSKKVLDAFKSEFSVAKEVSWTTGNNFYRAEFSMNGQKVFAYYATSGELLGLARYISSLQLPVHLLSELKNNYSGYWVSDLFEVNNNEGTHYYVTLENADKKVILKSTNGDRWSGYSKKIKA